MIRVYLAGPMTGYPDLNFPAFHAAAARLRASGYEVVNPAEINADPAAGWNACMRQDLAQLVTCEAIALLPGWKKSRGARLEHHIAMALGMGQVVVEHIRRAVPGRAKGGHASAASMSPQQRRERAKKGAAARWAKVREGAHG